MRKICGIWWTTRCIVEEMSIIATEMCNGLTRRRQNALNWSGRGREDYYTTHWFLTQKLFISKGGNAISLWRLLKHGGGWFQILGKIQAFLNQTDFIDADDSVYVMESFVGWLNHFRNKNLKKCIDERGEKISGWWAERTSLETTLRSIGIDPSVLSSSVLEELRQMANAQNFRPTPTEKSKTSKNLFLNGIYPDKQATERFIRILLRTAILNFIIGWTMTGWITQKSAKSYGHGTRFAYFLRDKILGKTIMLQSSLFC